MRLTLVLLFIGLTFPSFLAAQASRSPIQCGGVVECAEAMVAVTNTLAAENDQLRKRLNVLEQRMNTGRRQEMRRGAERVEGSRNGYKETTIVFKPPFRNPPIVFVTPRDVNIRDQQQLWIKSISNGSAVIANCRRHNNPESCLAYADDFHFDWIAVRR